MLMNLLKKYIHEKMPVYLGEIQIEIVGIYEEFGLVDIKFMTEDVVFAVDVIALSNKPYIEKSICINRLIEV